MKLGVEDERKKWAKKEALWQAKLKAFKCQVRHMCLQVGLKQGPARPMMRPLANFSFFIFQQLSHFFTLLVPPSSRPSFFLVQQCLNHLESEKIHFSAILTKALPTDGPTDGRTDKRTRPLKEMRTHLKMNKWTDQILVGSWVFFFFFRLSWSGAFFIGPSRVDESDFFNESVSR